VPWTGRSFRERQYRLWREREMDWQTRTGSRVLTVSFHDPTLVRLEHAAKGHVAQIGEEVCVR
jgi:hypothetical protein